MRFVRVAVARLCSLEMATNGETKLAVLDASHPATAPASMESGGAASYDDVSRHGQWLRAAVLGASDGLVSTSALMLGIGAARPGDPRTALLSGVAGLVAGACSMAIGEYVSVHAQLDVELAGLKRVEEARGYPADRQDRAGLPNPGHASAASALSFAAGAAIPLLAAWFVGSYRMRVTVVVSTATLALAVFGALGAVHGGAPAGRAGLRAALGGLVAMGITYGLMKLFRADSV
jgi:VIT1/CCC1 family predicted Fe2+/Mn2+ transporter